MVVRVVESDLTFGSPSDLVAIRKHSRAPKIPKGTFSAEWHTGGEGQVLAGWTVDSAEPTLLHQTDPGRSELSALASR